MLLAGGGALTALAGGVPSTARGRTGRTRGEGRTLRAEGASTPAFDRDATVAIVSERLEAWIETAVVQGSTPVDLDLGDPGSSELSVTRPAAVAYGGRCYSLETGRAPGDGGSACELRARRRAPPDDGGVHALSIPPLTADGRELVRRAAGEGPVALDESSRGISTLLERYDYVALGSGLYTLHIN